MSVWASVFFYEIKRMLSKLSKADCFFFFQSWKIYAICVNNSHQGLVKDICICKKNIWKEIEKEVIKFFKEQK